MHEVLIVDDDPQIRTVLRTTLSGQDYRLREAITVADGLAETKWQPPDAILLDLGLPDEDGMEVIRQVRRWNQNLPIIVMSVRSDERDKISAFDAGADDFVDKPFAVRELMARLRVAIRRSAAAQNGANTTAFRVGDIEVDLVCRKVLVAGK